MDKYILPCKKQIVCTLFLIGIEGPANFIQIFPGSLMELFISKKTSV